MHKRKTAPTSSPIDETFNSIIGTFFLSWLVILKNNASLLIGYCLHLCVDKKKSGFVTPIGTIAKVKPRLANLSLSSGHELERKSLFDDLQHLSALGETLSEQRQRHKILQDDADVLDREGP